MTEPQFRQAKGSTFKQPPAEVELFAEPEQPFTPPPELEWLPLPDWQPEPQKRHEIALFPYDGVPILAVAAGGAVAETVWRVTRQYSAAEGVWRFRGFWAKRNAGGVKLGFEPVGYRKLEV